MLEPNLLARFTTHLKEALQKALSFAIKNGRDLIEPGDLIVGLLQERGSIGAEILFKSHINLENAEEAFRGLPAPHQTGTPIAPDLSLPVKRLLEKCVLTAHVYEHKYVGTEHLLFALLETPLPDVHHFFETQNFSLDTAKEQLNHVLKSTSKFPDLSLRAAEEGTEEESSSSLLPRLGLPQEQSRAGRGTRPKALEVFARDLTATDVVAQLDPVIGREQEMERLIHILCRRLKNNPILLGEPGVGKTALVEGLAQRLSAGDVPDILQGRRILALDLTLMVAGTMYRGEFEARMKQLVEEAKADKNIILFIDEIHNIVGAGSTSGSLDAANILKPALARGEIRCIGATTWGEYKKYIEPDAALDRRYQPIQLQEPSPELTLRMLQGLTSRYEEHHGVRFEPKTVEAAVRLAERYLTERFFPDKAIDLMDEAAALVNAARRSQEPMERLRALDIAIQAARDNKESAVRDHQLEAASQAHRDEERLQKEKQSLERTIREAHQTVRLNVKPEHVAQVVSHLSGVPLSMVLADEREALLTLEERLSQAVLGQTDAVRAVSETVRHSRLGLTDPHRPKTSFLFLGPSGVGKTELARALAKEIFGREDALIKLDMSEFSEGHSVSKLLGSPAGYVGYRESNKLSDAIRKQPHAVLLFDEFEKAHPDVQNILLQALEDGKITDAIGRSIPFHHAYVILTSNVGADFLHRARLGFDQTTIQNRGSYDELVREHLTERFRGELLNRLDKIVIFQPLGREALKEILHREIELVFTRLAQTQKVAWSVSNDVLEWLLNQNLKVEEGARAARRIVEQEVTSLLGRALIEQPKRRTWNLKVSRKKLMVQ
ncbi:MAG: ATP-dependent Clp protease ATP-binding subunit [Candidatus Uhrbacteria bacterium]|nr:ATP-dependent Clp protease ATP-binding subunit [Candidatus Uhrbacteria bacterium]